MVDEGIYYAFDKVVPFVATCIDEGLGFVGGCELAGMNGLYTRVFEKMLFDQKL